MRRFLLAATFLAAAAPTAFALDCKTPTEQSDLNRCADQAFKIADAALNATYAEIVGRLASPDRAHAKTLLATAQRDWLAFRDAECAFRTSDSNGGSMHPMDGLGCLQHVTEARTAALRRYLSCKPEDSDCPAAPAN